MEGNPNIITGILDFSDIKTGNFWRELFAEFLGTFLLCFFGCSSICGQTDGMVGHGSPDLLLISLTFGLIVALCIFMFGEISGCHINPAVTIAMFVGRRLKLSRAIGYVVVQVIGGILGVGMLYIIANHEFKDDDDKIIKIKSQVGQLSIGSPVTSNTTSPDGVAQLRGMLAELLGTFLLLMVILSCTDQSRPATANWGGVPFAIGLAVATSHLALIKFTGSGINPARAFGAYVISGAGYSSHWIYWIGPIIGGILAVVVYDLILCPFYNSKTKSDGPVETQVLDNITNRENEYIAGKPPASTEA